MKVSILSYSFLGLFRAGMLDVFGYLESCKYRYNLGAANIWNGFLTSTQDDYLKKVREALDERELVLACLTCDGCHIWDPDAEIRKKYYASAMAHLKAGKILGAQFVRIDAGGPRGVDRASPAAKQWTDEMFDGIAKRYQEYAQYAYDNGFKMGPENHSGPEGVWPNMQKLYKAMNNHPGFGLSVHMSQWQGTPEEKDRADKESAPWVSTVHFGYDTCETRLVEKMNLLRDAGYKGYWIVEHHGGTNEYAEVALQVAHVRAVLESWRTGGTGAPARMGRQARPAGGP
jgi:sugar phosphate isomerase/epimerase